MGPGKDGQVDCHPFTALGFPAVADLLAAAETATKEMLGAAAVNFNCLSGVHAMMCAILATTEPGDTVMTVHHDHGGHFATSGILARVGRRNVLTSFDVDHLRFNTEELAKIYKESGAKAFYMDVSYYINPHNLREIRQALGEAAIIIYDASHTMGLILGQQFQSPFTEGANVICANTHKTLPGPQKGMIAFRDADLAQKANNIINSCLFSSPHTHHLIALATTLLEMKEFGQAYAQQIITNSNTLGEALAARGYELRRSNTGRYSENHQVHLFTDKIGDYRQLYDHFFRNHMAVNFDSPLGGRLFIRLGTQEVTRRGMSANEMKQIAEFIDHSLQGQDIRDQVEQFNSAYPHIYYSFDELPA
jgi:glycine hydroxymethyltransferase